MDTLGECHSFVEHRWKTGICLNCFRDKGKHELNPSNNEPQMSDTKSRLHGALSSRCLKLNASDFDSQQRERAKAIDSAGRSGFFGTSTYSILSEDVDNIEGFMRNVISIDITNQNTPSQSKHPEGADEDIGPLLGLTKNEKCNFKRLGKDVGVEGRTQSNETSEVRNGESVSYRENPCIPSNSLCHKSGYLGSDPTTSQQNRQKQETERQEFDEIEHRPSLGQKHLGTGPKTAGNSRCLDSNLPHGCVLDCVEFFSFDTIKDETNQTKINDNPDRDTQTGLGNESGHNSGKNLDRPIVDMVILQGKEVDKESGVVGKNSSHHYGGSNAIGNKNWPEIDAEREEIYPVNSDVGSRGTRERQYTIPHEFKEETQTIVTYANVVHERRLSEPHRHVFELVRLSRNNSIDSTDETFSTRIQKKFQGDYECMSSPDSISTSSSNRSSNTGSLHSNYSPDSLSLASFAARFNFGKGEGGKRCSQASSASQDSGRQSWTKTRDSFDLSDGGSTQFDRRSPSEHIYQNNSVLEPDVALSWNRNQVNKMEEFPPPLPERQRCQSSFGTKAPGVELIMPYKVVDLEELQKSLEDIEPYSVHNGSDSGDKDPSGQYLEPTPDLERSWAVHRDDDYRPVLPPKQRGLSQTKCDSSCSSGSSAEGVKERPTPPPRQSLVAVDDLVLARGANGPELTSTDEEASPTDESASVDGRLSRQKSLPVDRVTRSGRDSTSPQKTARPRRMAPLPPPSPPTTPSKNDHGVRPVSEMFPPSKPTDPKTPKPLKRSNTIALLQSPFLRIPVQKINGRSLDNQGMVQVTSSTSETGTGDSPLSEISHTGLVVDGKPVPPKEDAAKSGPSKTGAFFAKSNVFKKALITFKKPVTKKQAKKELVISPPMNFTNLCQPRQNADFETREEKTVSFLGNGDPGEKSCPDADPKTEMVDQQNEQVYHNFPISQAVDNPEEQLSPTKPPRTFTTSFKYKTNCHHGYLEPSTSQQTKDQEDEISQNKLPALGPLPSPPAEAPSPVTKDTPTTISGLDTSKRQENTETEKQATKAKPRVPRRPESFRQKKKLHSKSAVQDSEKPKPCSRNPSPSTVTAESTHNPSEHDTERGYITSRTTSRRSRSCELLNVDDSQDGYLSNMHVTVLKDILLCWRNMLRRPTINLTGACWEDFEVVEAESWPKMSDDRGSVLQPVQLKKSSRSLDSQNYGGQFIAKIKSQTQTSNSTKSSYDQDYSVCTTVESHENIARVLAYFRGDIKLPLLGLENGKSHIHTTISISDQVPAQTCDEFVAQSTESHAKDPRSYERTVCLLMLQCLKGLAHLHDAGFAHGNLTLSNMFLIKHANDIQLFLGNFGKCQPLPKGRRGTGTDCETEDVAKPASLRNDLTACSNILSAMLHLETKCKDANENVVNISASLSSPFFGFLKKASTRLRHGTTTLRQTVRLIQGLLWGPFKSGEVMCVLSENRAKEWLERQRAEFIAKLAMDEAFSRTLRVSNQPRFSMEDLMLCEYLCDARADSLIRTEKCWLLDR